MYPLYVSACFQTGCFFCSSHAKDTEWLWAAGSPENLQLFVALNQHFICYFIHQWNLRVQVASEEALCWHDTSPAFDFRGVHCSHMGHVVSLHIYTRHVSSIDRGASLLEAAPAEADNLSASCLSSAGTGSVTYRQWRTSALISGSQSGSALLPSRPSGGPSPAGWMGTRCWRSRCTTTARSSPTGDSRCPLISTSPHHR